MQFLADLKLIKRSGRTTPYRFDIESCTAAVKKMSPVPMEVQPLRDPPTAQAEIERIGLGWAHVKIVIFATGVWFAAYSVLHLTYLTADVISKEFDLTEFQRGVLSSSVWAGDFVGTLCSGVFMQWGRKKAIVVSLIGTAVCGGLAGVCSTYCSLIATRIAAGAFLGIGQPATFVLATECSPIAWRAVVTASVMAGCGTGEMFVEYLVGRDNADLDRIHWRRDSMIACVPVFGGAVLSWLFLYESPIYAALSGKTEEAMAILECMAYDNGSPVLVRGVQIPRHAIAAENSSLSMHVLLRKWRVIFGPTLLCTTSAMMYAMFVYNVFNTGSSYAFPQILIEEEANSPTNLLIIANLGQSCTSPLAMILVYACRRKTVAAIYASAAAASCAALGHSLIHGRSAIAQPLIILVKSVEMFGSSILPQYIAEVYPSAVRAHGTAICLASGRLASTLAPLMFEGVAHLANTGTFFYCVALLEVFCIVFVILLPVETANMMLEDDIPREASPCEK